MTQIQTNTKQASDEAVRASTLAADAASHAREALVGAAHSADETLGELALRARERLGSMPGADDAKLAVDGRAEEAKGFLRVKSASLRSRLASKRVIVAGLALAAFAVAMLIRQK